LLVNYVKLYKKVVFFSEFFLVVFESKARIRGGVRSVFDIRPFQIWKESRLSFSKGIFLVTEFFKKFQNFKILSLSCINPAQKVVVKSRSPGS